MEPKLLLVYGILKRGFALDLAHHGAKFISNAVLPNAQLYWIGDRAGVGLRFEDTKIPARGEVWEIPDRLWRWLDGIEQNGFCYTRKVVTTKCIQIDEDVQAWVYEHTFPAMRYTDPIPMNEF